MDLKLDEILRVSKLSTTDQSFHLENLEGRITNIFISSQSSSSSPKSRDRKLAIRWCVLHLSYYVQIDLVDVIVSSSSSKIGNKVV